MAKIEEPVAEPVAGPSLSQKRRLARKAKRNPKKFNLKDEFKKYCSASGKFPKIKFFFPLKKNLHKFFFQFQTQKRKK